MPEPPRRDSCYPCEGGDASEAEAVLIAVPGGTIAEALESVEGIQGKTVIDATNLVGVDPPGGFSSNAEFVKSKAKIRAEDALETRESPLDGNDLMEMFGRPPGP